jgi:hypothetical protein
MKLIDQITGGARHLFCRLRPLLVAGLSFGSPSTRNSGAKFAMVGKQLLLAGLFAACSISATQAAPPYIAAVIVDNSSWYGYYRYPDTGPWDEYNPANTLVDPNSDPYPWQSDPSLQIQVDPATSVTSAAWWAIEEWTNTPYWQWVYKHYYDKTTYPYSAPVPDHYSPINGMPLYVGAPGSDPSGFAHGQEVVTSPYSMRLVYVPRLKNFANTYYLTNGDGYWSVTVYIDGSYYIDNG